MNNFKLVFFSVFAIALISGGTAVNLSAQPNLTQEQKEIVTTCTDTWKICVGAIVGLIGGRTLPTKDDDDDEPPLAPA